MKFYYSKKKMSVLGLLLGTIAIATWTTGCIEGKKLAAKTGVELWAENCQRCHNAPTATTFNEQQWKTVGMHMQTRALLTDTERDKIIQFLQQGSR